MNPIGIAVIKMDNRREYHRNRCFPTLIDDNCDFIITKMYENDLKASRKESIEKLIAMGYEYIGWVDDDDEMIADIFSKLLEIFKNYPDTCIAFSEYIIRDEHKDTRRRINSNENVVDVVNNISLVHQPVLIPSKILSKYLYVLDGHAERSLYLEIKNKETDKLIRGLSTVGYIYYNNRI